MFFFFTGDVVAVRWNVREGCSVEMITRVGGKAGVRRGVCVWGRKERKKEGNKRGP